MSNKKQSAAKNVFPLPKTKMAPQTRSAPNREARNIFQKAVIVLAIFFIILMPVLIFAIGLYIFHWHDPITSRVVKIVPYPAAVVDYSIINYEQFREDTGQLAYYYHEQEQATQGAIPALEASQIESQVLNRLIDEKIISQEAKRRKITVTAKEIDQEYQKIIDQARSAKEVESILSHFYNYSPGDFKAKVLQPFLLRRKLDQALLEDAALKDRTNQKAIELRSQVLAQVDEFASLAEEFSDHPSHLKGGDTGYISLTSLEKAVQEEVEKLAIGDITPVVETDQGFWFFLLAEKDSAASGQGKIRGRQILITPVGVEEWLLEQRGQLFIWRFF